MNDLNPPACCHISDKIGRNENRSLFAPVLWVFPLLCHYWDLFKFRVNLQTISTGNLHHQIRALGGSANPQDGIAFLQ
jgi:hypothetical protein